MADIWKADAVLNKIRQASLVGNVYAIVLNGNPGVHISSLKSFVKSCLNGKMLCLEKNATLDGIFNVVERLDDNESEVMFVSSEDGPQEMAKKLKQIVKEIAPEVGQKPPSPITDRQGKVVVAEKVSLTPSAIQALVALGYNFKVSFRLVGTLAGEVFV